MYTYIKGNEKLIIEQDDICENPRTSFDNIGTAVFFGKYSHLGDVHDIETIAQANRIENKHISLPVYMYSHSGETISTTPFSCPWDSGKLGFIYVTAEKLREEYGWKRITAKRKEQVLEYLKDEITTLDQYLTGDIYSFTHIVNGEEKDNCGGFYGNDFNDIFDCIGSDISKWTEVEQSGIY